METGERRSRTRRVLEIRYALSLASLTFAVEVVNRPFLRAIGR